jgi:hypothetical protein
VLARYLNTQQIDYTMTSSPVSAINSPAPTTSSRSRQP